MLRINNRKRLSSVLLSALIVCFVFLFLSCEADDEYANYSRKIEELTPETPETVSESLAQTDNSKSDSDTYKETVSENTVVYVTKSGKKFHSKPDCSGMKDPEKTTAGEAVKAGYSPCKRCN